MGEDNIITKLLNSLVGLLKSNPSEDVSKGLSEEEALKNLADEYDKAPPLFKLRFLTYLKDNLQSCPQLVDVLSRGSFTSGFIGRISNIIKDKIDPNSNPQYRYKDVSSRIAGLRWFKLWWKRNILGRQQTGIILPKTKNHEAWILTAQLAQGKLNELLKKLNKSRDEVLRFCVLTPSEKDKIASDRSTNTMDLPLLDHGMINRNTQKNQTVKGFLDVMDEFYKKSFGKIPLVHCMASASRSNAVFVLALYLARDQEKLFDFSDEESWKDQWEKARNSFKKEERKKLLDEKEAEIFQELDLQYLKKNPIGLWFKKKILKAHIMKTPAFWEELKFRIDKRVDALKKSLDEGDGLAAGDGPTICAISDYVHSQHQVAKTLEKLDSEKIGFLGLMALHKLTKNKCQIINDRVRTKAKLFKHAQDIGLILSSTLDVAYRENEDLKLQFQNLREAYTAFQNKGIDLFSAMVCPRKESVPDNYQDRTIFKQNFDKLTVRQKAHFAIILKRLKTEQPRLDLPQFTDADVLSFATSSDIMNGIKKLTAGDQVELLRAFGEMQAFKAAGLTYHSVINKITSENGVDRYNAGIQLAELASILSEKASSHDEFIKKALKVLNDKEQTKFSEHARGLNIPNIDSYFPQIEDYGMGPKI
jgi:hypothetical protein